MSKPCLASPASRFLFFVDRLSPPPAGLKTFDALLYNGAGFANFLLCNYQGRRYSETVRMRKKPIDNDALVFAKFYDLIYLFGGFKIKGKHQPYSSQGFDARML